MALPRGKREQYETFLDRSLAGLGARLLAGGAVAGPSWMRGWDRVALADDLGNATVFAFTDGSSGVAGVRELIDRLAEGLAEAGFSGRSVNLVAVVAPDTDERPDAKFRRLSPSRYYPGLRPFTWVVDLETGRVQMPRFGQPQGREVLVAAARGDGAPSVSPIRQREQLHDFRLLMSGRQPLVTYGLIAVNVTMFLLLFPLGGPTHVQALLSLGALQPRLIEQGQWWRLGSAIFLHAGIPHILFNMMSLFAVGTLAERLYGNIRFLAIYLGAGLIGSVASFGFAVTGGHMNVVGVGASGAIFGVAGALVTVRFHRSDVIPTALRRRISTSILPLILISLVIAYLTPFVDNAAHVGGLLGGMALSFAFPLTRTLSPRRRWWQ